MKKPRVPRTRAGGRWTESQFFGFLRSGIRQKTQRWPPLHDAFVRSRRLATEQDKKKWGTKIKFTHQCAKCLDWFPRKEVNGDHIKPCGSFRSFHDAAGFLERSFPEVDGYQILCYECHDIKTKLDKENAV